MSENTSTKSLQCAELGSFRQQLLAVIEQASKVADGLSDAQMNWRPHPGRWSVGECIEHLSATVEPYFPVMQRAIATGRAKNLTGTAPFKYKGLMVNYLINSFETPPKKKFKSPKIFLPPANPVIAADVLARFERAHRQLIELAEAADGLHLAKVRFASPAFALIRMGLGQAFELHIRHAFRHLWQAEQVRADSQFPKN